METKQIERRFYFYGSDYVKLILRVREIEIDKINNTSTVEWELWLERGSTYVYNLNSDSLATAWFGGEQILKKWVSYDLRNAQWVSFGKGTKVIPHDLDGTKAITLWAGLTNVAGLGTIPEFSDSMNLTKIDRESPVKKVTASQLGESVTVEIDRKVESFKHQMWYRINDSEWFDLGTNIAYMKEFIPSIDLAKHILASDTGSIDICVRTFNQDNVQIGSDSYSYGNKIKVPDSIVPTIQSFNVVEKEGRIQPVLPSNEFIYDISRIGAKIVGAQGAYGSTISGYRITLENQVITSSEGTFTRLPIGEKTIVAEVTDTRGRKARIEKSIKVHDYQKPLISVFFPIRSGNRTNKNVKAQTSVRTSAIMVNGRNVNEYRIQVKYSKRGKNNWISCFTSTESVDRYAKEIDLGSVYNIDEGYDFKIIVSDKFGENSVDRTIGTSVVLLVLGKNRLSLGGVPEDDETGFIVNMTSKFKNTVNFTTGNVFSEGRKIQLYELTDKNGYINQALEKDANTMYESGVYYLESGKNVPSAFGFLEVYINNGFSGKRGFQRFITSNGSVVYFRVCEKNRWGAWKIQDHYLNEQWTTVSPQNGWLHYPDYGYCQFSRKDDTVYLRGSLKGGKEDYNTTLFTLPEGCRPSQGMFVAGLNNDYGNAVVFISSAGNVSARSGITKNWITFDNVSFKI